MFSLILLKKIDGKYETLTDSMYNFVINNQHNYKSMYFW